MARREYDPVLAAQSLRALAAMTDGELAADVRAAAAEVFERVDELAATGWPQGVAERRAHDAQAGAREALAKLAEDAPLPAVVAAAAPILGQFWSDSPGAARAASEAVDRLRLAAKHQPRMASDARRIVEHGLADD